MATVTALALAIGVALVARTGPDLGLPEATSSNDPAVAGQDLRAGALVACLHGNDAPRREPACTTARPSRSWRPAAACAAPTPACPGWPAWSRRPSPSAAGAEPAAVRCIGNGTSGNRIQTIYAHAHDVPDRYQSVVTSLREWMAQADQAVWTSAGQTGGGRRLRFVTDQDCQLDVARVTLTPSQRRPALHRRGRRHVLRRRQRPGRGDRRLPPRA